MPKNKKNKYLTIKTCKINQENEITFFLIYSFSVVNQYIDFLNGVIFVNLIHAISLKPFIITYLDNHLYRWHLETSIIWNFLNFQNWKNYGIMVWYEKEGGGLSMEHMVRAIIEKTHILLRLSHDDDCKIMSKPHKERESLCAALL